MTRLDKCVLVVVVGGLILLRWAPWRGVSSDALATTAEPDAALDDCLAGRPAPVRRCIAALLAARPHPGICLRLDPADAAHCAARYEPLDEAECERLPEAAVSRCEIKARNNADRVAECGRGPERMQDSCVAAVAAELGRWALCSDVTDERAVAHCQRAKERAERHLMWEVRALQARARRRARPK